MVGVFADDASPDCGRATGSAALRRCRAVRCSFCAAALCKRLPLPSLTRKVTTEISLNLRIFSAFMIRHNKFYEIFS